MSLACYTEGSAWQSTSGLTSQFTLVLLAKPLPLPAQ